MSSGITGPTTSPVAEGTFVLYVRLGRLETTPVLVVVRAPIPGLKP
nr:hypothetical protein [Halobellus ruber]